MDSVGAVGGGDSPGGRQAGEERRRGHRGRRGGGERSRKQDTKGWVCWDLGMKKGFPGGSDGMEEMQ